MNEYQAIKTMPTPGLGGPAELTRQEEFLAVHRTAPSFSSPEERS